MDEHQDLTDVAPPLVIRRDGPPPNGEERREVIVPALVRHLVAQVAPDELPMFEEITEAWTSGRLAYQRPTRRGAGDGTMRVGVLISLNSEVIFAVVTGALANVLGDLAIATWQRSRRRWWSRLPRPRTGRGRHLLPRDAVPAGSVILLGHEVPAFRQACLERGRALGLADGEAAALADASVGALLAVARRR